MAKVRYSAPSSGTKQLGKPFFISVAILFAAFVGLWLAVRPPAFVDCKDFSDPECACPSSDASISKRNLIFIDATDNVRDGKFDDIEHLIEGVAYPDISLFDWLRSGKKVERTTVYALSNNPPADMTPIASFCSLPPNATFLATELTAVQEKKLIDAAKRKVKETVLRVSSVPNAPSSPIVEGLAVATSNASAWNPGSSLVIVSDLLENSAACGYFERVKTIPPYKSAPTACMRWADTLVQRLRATASYPEDSTIAVCQLWGKQPKPGLIAFWQELFQTGLGYGLISSCDPQEIRSRREVSTRRPKSFKSEHS